MQATDAIISWIPLMIFAFLFGLSMDYEVFMLTRMREAYDETGDTKQAISLGLARTGKLVTSAALVLMFAFFALSTSPGPDIKQFGIGLAAGIIFDATVIRALLVPVDHAPAGRLELVAARWAGPDPPRPAELRLKRVPSTACDDVHAVLGSFDAADFDRAVALVSVEASPRALVERLGLDWEYLVARSRRLGSGAGRAGGGTRRRRLVRRRGVHGRVPDRRPPARGAPARGRLLAAAVDAVQERGRHAVIADHCDLASVARLETVYSDALVESMAVAAEEREALRSPVTRIFEAGLAVGLELGSGGDGDGSEQP